MGRQNVNKRLLLSLTQEPPVNLKPLAQANAHEKGPFNSGPLQTKNAKRSTASDNLRIAQNHAGGVRFIASDYGGARIERLGLC